MAKSATGKWVSKVGASGGSKAYKKTRPSNYYATLVIIVVLGLGATVLARYDYQHPAAAAVGTPPAIGTTWFAALNVDVCGESLPYLKSDPASIYGLKVQANNVIQISPVSAADSGSHATLGQFAVEFPGLVASSNVLGIPSAAGVANAATTYRNGQLCPTSSKYAHQAGQVQYAYWTSFSQTKPTVTTNPSSIKFAQDMRVTMAFVPKGVTPLPPSTATVNAMVADQASSATTTTTAVTTTTGVTATTAVPTTTVTKATTTTTTKKATTTTTAKG
ncbi:MAG: hypothetical protein HKL85_08640 [Acidimicrobiaceae bacterium]|nr:hypothetical protein [Acidimicrobiaceae bacterium]